MITQYKTENWLKFIDWSVRYGHKWEKYEDKFMMIRRTDKD